MESGEVEGIQVLTSEHRTPNIKQIIRVVPNYDADAPRGGHASTSTGDSAGVEHILLDVKLYT